jgi:hypothetical protein
MTETNGSEETDTLGVFVVSGSGAVTNEGDRSGEGRQCMSCMGGVLELPGSGKWRQFRELGKQTRHTLSPPPPAAQSQKAADSAKVELVRFNNRSAAAIPRLSAVALSGFCSS